MFEAIKSFVADLAAGARQAGGFDANERLRLIETMWQVAYADGTASEFENNLIWRVAALLGVSSHEAIALRQRVAAARGNSGA